MLVLPIKKKWFDMIKSGEKKEEYREFKRYYDNRLPKYFGTFITDVNGISYGWNENNERIVVFRNGYSRLAPQIKCLCTLSIGSGIYKWGAEPHKQYYILKILKIYKEDERNGKRKSKVV